MKRAGRLYEKICNIENIKLAILNASKGKRNKCYVKRILDDIDKKATELSISLLMHGFTPSAYITKTIFDGSSGKAREISKPKFYPDQVVHWALMLHLQPIFMRGMYEHNCGSIPGRGTAHGQKMIRRWLGDRKNTKYCLKMDISKFYPSVNGEIMKQKVRGVVKCHFTLELIDAIIDSANGLPIGNFTSQWLANFFLQDLDHAIKEKFGAKYYVRYVDDLVVLGANKRKLHRMRLEIDSQLKQNGLTMKKNWQVFRVDDRGIDF